MKFKLKRIFALIMVVFVVASMGIPVSAENTTKDITILFTHDLHSHLLPALDENGNQYGGYAQLMTAIEQQKEKYPDAILVDGGDFSMGSLFQTAFATSAIELRMMGAMGYDVTTFGNHEFDYLPEGLTSMLNVASSCSEAVPEIVEANYTPDENNQEMQDALDNYGVKNYTVIQRGGLYYVIFGIFGYDSHDCSPNSGMILSEPAVKAQETVDEAVAYCKETYNAEPVVICLSHSGTEDGKGEDYELAQTVDGIDLIISAHTHTTLEEPIQVNDTYVVSAGEYGKYLGVANMKFTGDKAEMTDYQLIPIDETVEENKKIAKLTEKFKTNVEQDYLADYGVTFDEVLVNNQYKFDTVDEVYATQHESTLGNLFSDAYKWAVENATDDEVDVALTAAGVIRESIPLGDVTVSDVFNSASLGVGTEGELIAVYITGKDLKNALEVDASVQPLMKSAQLFCSGIEYSFNTKRMIFNKVDYAMLRNSDGSLEKIDDEKLYKVVTGMYAGQMLGSVKKTSMGLLEITPRDKDGNPIESDDLVNYVVQDKNGNPLKEWYAIASYLQNMGGNMDEKYAQPDGRKSVYSSLKPSLLFSNANVFTYALLGIIVLLLLIIVLIIWLIIRKRKRKKDVK